MKHAPKVLLWVLATPILGLVWLWTSLAIHYSSLPWEWLRTPLAWFVGVGGPISLACLPRRRRPALVLFGTFIVVAGSFASIRPSNDRDWQTKVAVLPDVEFDGDEFTVLNVRNFDYRSEDDFDVHYYDRTFDLAQLQALDFIVSYWDGNEDIAHTMMSFDFGGVDVLTVSVEVRREKGEGWGGLPGMFKQFELIYVLADERDIVRLRTNYIGEEVYLFRLQVTPEEARMLLVDILRSVHELNRQPRFYRTIAQNCTTTLVEHINSVWPGRMPWTKRILMNGYLPEQGYDKGSIRNDLPFEEVMQLSYINEMAVAAGDDPEFSRRIRAHLEDV